MCRDMTQVRDVVIVGAGLLGLAAARVLAGRGRDVVVLEQARVGHDAGGSKGSCRIFRLGYPDPEYVAAAMRARELWHELESESGRRILLPVPQLSFGAGLQTIHDAMRQAGAPCELLTEVAAAERFPAIRTGGAALLEPESCVTAAAEGLAALADSVVRHGGEIRTGVRVTSLGDDGRQVTLRTAAERITARTAIVTAGPWSTGLLASLGVTVPSRPTLEQVAYLAPRDTAPGDTAPGDTAPGDTAAGDSAVPIFLCHGEQAPYGLPVPGSSLYKIGIHPSGQPTDPDAQDHSTDASLLARLSGIARRHLPGHDPQPVRAERCIYDNSPDEDFVVDRVGNVVIGCGTSGHGFKFGPVFGEWLAALATTDAAAPGAPSARFALARFGWR